MRRVAIGMVVLHGALAPAMLSVQAWFTKPLSEALFNGCEDRAARGPGADRRTAVFINSNDLCVSYIGMERAVRRLPAPRALLLASALYDVEARRLDAVTLDLSVPQGMQSNPADSLLRDRRDVLPIGTQIVTPEARFEVRTHNAVGLVDGVRVRFGHPLEDPRYQWLCTVEARVVDCEPPAIGEVLKLPRAL